MRGDLNVNEFYSFDLLIILLTSCFFLDIQAALNPIPLYKQGVEEEKSELARLVNIMLKSTKKKNHCLFINDFSHHLLVPWL